MTKEYLIELYKKEVCSIQNINRRPPLNTQFQIDVYDILVQTENTLRIAKTENYFFIIFFQLEERPIEFEITKLEYQELKDLLFLKPTQKTNMKTQKKHPELKWLLSHSFWLVILLIFISMIGMIWFNETTTGFLISKKMFISAFVAFLFIALVYRIFCFDSQEEEDDDNVGIK